MSNPSIRRHWNQDTEDAVDPNNPDGVSFSSLEVFVDFCGGPAACAKKLGVSPNTIWLWNRNGVPRKELWRFKNWDIELEERNTYSHKWEGDVFKAISRYGVKRLAERLGLKRVAVYLWVHRGKISNEYITRVKDILRQEGLLKDKEE